MEYLSFLWFGFIIAIGVLIYKHFKKKMIILKTPLKHIIFKQMMI